MPTSSPEPSTPDPGGPPRRRWIVVGVLLAVVAIGVSVVDRRGDRVLAPPPAPADGGPPTMPELAASRIGLHVSYDLEDAFARVDSTLPSRFGNLVDRRTHPRNRRITHAVALRREPLELSLRGDTIHASTTIHYQGRVWFDSPVGGEISASCRNGESGIDPRAVVRLRSPLDLQSDWSLRTRIEVLEVSPATQDDRDRCVVSLGPLSVDVTDALLAMAEDRLEDATEEVDAMLRGLDLAAGLEPRWAHLQEPLAVGSDLWLTVAVDSLVVEEVSGRGESGRELFAGLAVIGRPRIVMGRRPDYSPTALPPLVEGPAPDDFSALLDAEIEYQHASLVLDEALRGRTVEVAGRPVEIVEALVFGAGGGRLAVEVEVDGSLRGRLYLVGTPVLDPASGEVTVPDLGFSVSSRNVLLEGAAWLLRGTFPDLVRRRLRWNVEGVTRRLTALSGQRLDLRPTEAVRVEGALSSVRILGVTSGEDRLFVRSRGDGNLRFRVGPVAPASSPSPSAPRDL